MHYTFTKITHPHKVKFAGYTATVEIYTVDQDPGVISKIQLWCEDGPLATATYPHSVRPEPGEVIVKSVNENKGLLEALLNAEIIQPPHKFHQLGHTVAPVCKVNLSN